MKGRELTEFEQDLISLNKTIEEQNIEGYRIVINYMFHKMQCSNTKQYYKDMIDRLTLAKTGEHYDNLFFIGFKGNSNGTTRLSTKR